MTSEKILRDYSYFFLAIGGGFLAYAIFRNASCGIGVHGDFCRLAGFAYLSLYGIPALFLGGVSYIIPKWTESKKTINLMIFILSVITIQMVLGLFAN